MFSARLIRFIVILPLPVILVMLFPVVSCYAATYNLCPACACMLSHFSHVRLCDAMDSSLPGSSAQLQVRIMQWVAIPSSRGSC